MRGWTASKSACRNHANSKSMTMARPSSTRMLSGQGSPWVRASHGPGVTEAGFDFAHLGEVPLAGLAADCSKYLREFLDPEQSAAYRKSMTPANWKRVFGLAPAP